MTLRIPAKVLTLIHVWSYDFYDIGNMGKQRRHMIRQNIKNYHQFTTPKIYQIFAIIKV